MKRMLTQSGDWMIEASTDKGLLSDIPIVENYTGSLPKTASTAAYPFQKLQRFGNITQASSPTPANPVPLVCNCGEITEEMFGSIIPGDTLTEFDQIVVPAVYAAETLTVSDGGSNSQTCAITPLFKSAGGTADVLDVLTGKITRNVGVVVITGMEPEWTLVSSGCPDYPLSGVLKGELVWCSHFKSCAASLTTTQMPDGAVKTSNTTDGHIYFKHSTYTNDLNGWITWLQEQYDAGTPVVVAYRLTTPEIIYQDPKALNTYATSTAVGSSYASATVDMTYKTA